MLYPMQSLRQGLKIHQTDGMQVIENSNTTLKNIVHAAPAATVILVQEKNGVPEIFMAQREKRTHWGSQFVFPGGTVTNEDMAVHTLQHKNMSPKKASTRLGIKSGGLGIYSAAIRELTEEAGVLLAQKPDDTWMTPESVKKIRVALSTGSPWSELLSTHDLRLATDTLHYIGHWETPLVANPRFSNRFFLAKFPPNHSARHDGKELVDSCWLTASEALRLEANGEIQIPRPHLKHLEILANFLTIDSLQNWAKTRYQQGITKVRPWIEVKDGRQRVLLPGDPDYPEDKA